MTAIDMLMQMLVLLMLMGAALVIPLKMLLLRRTYNMLTAFLLRDFIGWIGHKVFGPPTVQVRHGSRRRRRRRRNGHTLRRRR